MSASALLLLVFFFTLATAQVAAQRQSETINITWPVNMDHNNNDIRNATFGIDMIHRRPYAAGIGGQVRDRLDRLLPFQQISAVAVIDHGEYTRSTSSSTAIADISLGLLMNASRAGAGSEHGFVDLSGGRTTTNAYGDFNTTSIQINWCASHQKTFLLFICGIEFDRILDYRFCSLYHPIRVMLQDNLEDTGLQFDSSDATSRFKPTGIVGEWMPIFRVVLISSCGGYVTNLPVPAVVRINGTGVGGIVEKNVTVEASNNIVSALFSRVTMTYLAPDANVSLVDFGMELMSYDHRLNSSVPSVVSGSKRIEGETFAATEGRLVDGERTPYEVDAAMWITREPLEQQERILTLFDPITGTERDVQHHKRIMAGDDEQLTSEEYEHYKSQFKAGTANTISLPDLAKQDFYVVLTFTASVFGKPQEQDRRGNEVLRLRNDLAELEANGTIYFIPTYGTTNAPRGFYYALNQPGFVEEMDLFTTEVFDSETSTATVRYHLPLKLHAMSSLASTLEETVRVVLAPGYFVDHYESKEGTDSFDMHLEGFSTTLLSEYRSIFSLAFVFDPDIAYLSALIEIGDCSKDSGQPLDLALHPFRFGIGSDPLPQYYFGALIMNPVVMAVVMGIAFLLSKRAKDENAANKIFPHALIVVSRWFYPGTIYCAFAIIRFIKSEYIFIAWVFPGVLFALAYPAAFTRAAMYYSPQYSSVKVSTLRSCLAKLACPLGVYRPFHADHIKYRGAYYLHRGPKKWFCAVEFVTWLASAIAPWVISRCEWRFLVPFGACATHFTILAFSAPHMMVYTNLIAITSDIIKLVALAHLFFEQQERSFNTILSAWLLFSAVVALLVVLFETLEHFCGFLFIRRALDDAEYENETSSAGSVGLLFAPIVRPTIDEKEQFVMVTHLDAREAFKNRQNLADEYIDSEDDLAELASLEGNSDAGYSSRKGAATTTTVLEDRRAEKESNSTATSGATPALDGSRTPSKAGATSKNELAMGSGFAEVMTGLIDAQRNVTGKLVNAKDKIGKNIRRSTIAKGHSDHRSKTEAAADREKKKQRTLEEFMSSDEEEDVDRLLFDDDDGEEPLPLPPLKREVEYEQNRFDDWGLEEQAVMEDLLAQREEKLAAKAKRKEERATRRLAEKEAQEAALREQQAQEDAALQVNSNPQQDLDHTKKEEPEGDGEEEKKNVHFSEDTKDHKMDKKQQRKQKKKERDDAGDGEKEEQQQEERTWKSDYEMEDWIKKEGHIKYDDSKKVWVTGMPLKPKNTPKDIQRARERALAPMTPEEILKIHLQQQERAELDAIIPPLVYKEKAKPVRRLQPQWEALRRKRAFEKQIQEAESQAEEQRHEEEFDRSKKEAIFLEQQHRREDLLLRHPEGFNRHAAPISKQIAEELDARKPKPLDPSPKTIVDPSTAIHRDVLISDGDGEGEEEANKNPALPRHQRPSLASQDHLSKAMEYIQFQMGDQSLRKRKKQLAAAAAANGGSPHAHLSPPRRHAYSSDDDEYSEDDSDDDDFNILDKKSGNRGHQRFVQLDGNSSRSIAAAQRRMLADDAINPAPKIPRTAQDAQVALKRVAPVFPKHVNDGLKQQMEETRAGHLALKDYEEEKRRAQALEKMAKTTNSAELMWETLVKEERTKREEQQGGGGGGSEKKESDGKEKKSTTKENNGDHHGRKEESRATEAPSPDDPFSPAAGNDYRKRLLQVWAIYAPKKTDADATKLLEVWAGSEERLFRKMKEKYCRGGEESAGRKTRSKSKERSSGLKDGTSVTSLKDKPAYVPPPSATSPTVTIDPEQRAAQEIVEESIAIMPDAMPRRMPSQPSGGQRRTSSSSSKSPSSRDSERKKKHRSKKE